MFLPGVMVKAVHIYTNLAVLCFICACTLFVVANNYYYGVTPLTPENEAYSDNSFNGSREVKSFQGMYAELVRISSSNPTESDWLINDIKEDICLENETTIIAIVPSSVQNFELRQQIRNSWASDGLIQYNHIKAIFIVGATTNTGIQMKVEEEAKLHRDVIQTSFMDAYRNLTYKTVSALKWVLENCNNVPWVAKIDDDVVLNPFNLKRFVDERYRRNNYTSPPQIFGRLRKHSTPMPTGKWVVTKKEYPYKHYPKFILGSAYVIGQSAIKDLVHKANSTPFLWLEDVFVTGLVAEGAKIDRINIENEYFSTRITTKLVKGKAIFIVGLKPKMYKYAWTQILKHSVFMKGRRIL